ncbi:MAG: CDP-diacylglycerol--glycerol-3-phosphate 3-phosphatidyltransferase [Turicibacter sp.]|jgi:CDP-diacylglycerol--glycerol-3-phosphate 3-phosphatidyltransferase|uniref:CDP-diacylglycerol--glycerol-3-phosphate 3-phosphatidyltransferase n=1 Tax=Turicibacter faecis TaxID=2963365 RepID=A0ABM8IGZ8_9FIRM|nr:MULTISPECIES: CDP-diacylglycerol--glycerol-3-phosphate 3-phosphatidyltransferase [unclassified Turicibacter]MCI8702460.1 CDP-diacylglycerol--glycerol-3-phosphate 3-phosphatidyltransferase [Turicibacter sp.]BEH90499.1 CDP-diacylglycerol--glycerol-3-phosphate 3-phosphatidyltransferase [Turicibacter sp. TC023]MCI9351034.1 CDP-diacylglycerol--glycerol-3-phosphate 3-phosphatidyltransferase [Turicibacter sp.]MCU7204264.1 CDP-diacylglycerol--glycerol-3-phosphate 3-phosphatidyltransferase [Turicibac
MNLANKLTLLRIILIPFFIVCFYIPSLIVNTVAVNNYLIPYANLLGLIIFLLAAITDFIDGYVARKYNMITDFGKFMDPLADKLLVTAALLVLLENGLISGWVVFVILAREFIVTGFRTIAASKGVVIAAGWLGKIKTVVQFMMISTLLLLNYPFEIFNWPVDRIFIALAVVLTVASGVEYIYKNLHIFDEAK